MGMQVCSPWTTPDKLCCEGGGTSTSCDGTSTPLVYEWTDADFILAASNILFERTCYLYPGTCPQIVWPCICCGCQRHPCACGTYSAIELPTDYDVLGITQITEDGVVLAPAAYRLERRNVVVRLDGLTWNVNSFNLPNSSAVETIVEFDAGRLPPIELEMAAAELACELKKACNGNDCDLPPHVKSLARRGVSIDLADLSDLLKTGTTGLPMVDHAISIHGKCGGASFHDPAHIYRGWSVS